MERQQILNFLEAKVSKQRYQHCLGVEQTAVSLAPKFNVDPHLASVAALLHDVCREYDPDLLLQLASKFDILIDEIALAEPILLHGAVGAQLVKEELGIEDNQILEAITYHITGAPNLCALSNLIFIADFIEPGRTFEQANVLRDEASSLEPEAILLRVFNNTLHYVIDRHYLIHPNTIAGRNELIMKGHHKNNG